MVPKRVQDRLVRSLAKFQQVIKIAKDRDVNESDTVSIIRDTLAEVFGYDKHLDITSEFAVRGTYCDLAIKNDGKVEYLIEAKAIGLDLKDSHLRQAIEYGANKGVQWVILTNADSWQVYKIRFEQPIAYDLVCAFNFLDLNPKNDEHLEMLFVVCKEGLAKDAREEFHEKTQTVNRFVLGALILTDDVVSVIRRELRKLSDGVLISPEEICKVLRDEVLKRDVLEGDEAAKASTRIRKFYGKLARRARSTSDDKKDSGIDTLSIGEACSSEMQASED
ncbi:MAG: restriction endonuclease subunit R [Candidatus Methylomirabilota bacterium]|nr:type I restriction enzyme HsdR N-terminal domain-containing protein [candidate division NC10 bacterium]PWB42427.1 MAG: restriction endonuclease subunit R [candidate division NC10 bacterium]